MRDPVPADSFVEVTPYTGWLADDDPNIRCTPSWHADRSRRNFAGSGFGNTSGFDPRPPPAGGGTLQPGAARDFPGLGTAGRIRADSERIPHVLNHHHGWLQETRQAEILTEQHHLLQPRSPVSIARPDQIGGSPAAYPTSGRFSAYMHGNEFFQGNLSMSAHFPVRPDLLTPALIDAGLRLFASFLRQCRVIDISFFTSHIVR